LTLLSGWIKKDETASASALERNAEKVHHSVYNYGQSVWGCDCLKAAKKAPYFDM